MQKTLMMVILGLTASQTAYASSLFNGKGTAVHDSRTQACLLAEQAARLDAAPSRKFCAKDRNLNPV